MKHISFKKILAAALALTLVAGGSSLLWRGAATAEESSQSQTVVVTSPFTAAVAQVRSSVVGVNNYQTVRYSNYGNDFGFGWGGFGGRGWGSDSPTTTQEVKYAAGSGVVIADGYVLTNHHVVEDATKLTIAVMDEGAKEPTEYEAVLVTSDSNLDVAIIYCPTLKIAPVQLGDSDTLQVGDWAICIGNPLSDTFFGTVTAGIVSALNRNISSTSYDRYGRRETITNTMIQVDAAINSGNSGGGMFSVTGELMGIPTLKYTGSAYSNRAVDGIGMCIPINAAKPMINDVLSGVIETPEQSVKNEENAPAPAANSLNGKPRLGVTIAQLNGSSTAIVMGIIPSGVYVREVDENGPAQEAGMQQGDIIVEVNGELTPNISTLQNLVAQFSEGDTMTVKVYRAPGMADALEKGAEIPKDGEYIEMQVTLRIIDDVKQ